MYLESRALEIKGDLDWVRKILAIDAAVDFRTIHNLAGFRCVIDEYSISTEDDSYEYWNDIQKPTKKTINIRLREVVMVKSPEKVAAEEAVRKARESLKAAEEVLNKVKKEN